MNKKHESTEKRSDYIYQVMLYCVKKTHSEFKETIEDIAIDIHKLKQECERCNRRDHYNGLIIMHENALEKETYRYEIDMKKAYYYKINTYYDDYKEFSDEKTAALNEYIQVIRSEIDDIKEYILKYKLKRI